MPSPNLPYEFCETQHPIAAFNPDQPQFGDAAMTTISAENTVLSPKTRHKPYPAQKARGGEIILKTTWARVIFFTGLFGGLALIAGVALYFGIVS